MATPATAGPSDAAVAFAAMAPFYDDFTAHHNYEFWLGNMLRELEQRGLAGTRLLDFACGTGKSFIPMLERGWQVTACDISPEMTAWARAKVGGAARVEVADARALPVLGEFDVAWALGDVVNYLVGDGELELALTGVRANLRPGGLLLFDANTIHTYRTFFAETHALDPPAGRRLVWCGQATADVAPGSICEAILEMAEVGGVCSTSVHRQRHRPTEEVRQALDETGFECLAVLGNEREGSMADPLDEDVHTKAIFIARSSRETGGR
jgi:SAM-dependent methyltransferase